MIGLGTDLVDLERMADVLQRRGDAFLEKVFTERERGAFSTGDHRVAEVAARFAAKEAALKALGCGWGQGVGWHDVEVLGGRGKPPQLELAGPALARANAAGSTSSFISMTHCETHAAATVILA